MTEKDPEPTRFDVDCGMPANGIGADVPWKEALSRVHGEEHALPSHFNPPNTDPKKGTRPPLPSPPHPGYPPRLWLSPRTDRPGAATPARPRRRRSLAPARIGFGALCSLPRASDCPRFAPWGDPPPCLGGLDANAKAFGAGAPFLLSGFPPRLNTGYPANPRSHPVNP